MAAETSLPTFVVAHVRGHTPREIATPLSNAVPLEIDSEVSTVTVDPHHSVLVDQVFDARAVKKSESLLDTLWSQLKPALSARLDAAGEATVLLCGPSKSGKSSLLFGDEVDDGSPAAGLLPRFVRSAFESGGRGGAVPTAMEVSMLHVSDEILFDLLNPEDPTTETAKQKLQLRWSTGLQGPFVTNLSTSVATSAYEVLQLLHEGLAMRALHFHHTGHNVNSHSCHLVATLTLLERPPRGPLVFGGGGSVTFVEAGDFSFEPWSHGPDAHLDRLKHVWSRTERSRRGLGTCCRALAEQSIERPEVWPPDLPTSLYQNSALPYLLARPLHLGLCLWVGCFLPSASPEGTRSQAALTALLLDAKSAATHPPAPPGHLSSARVYAAAAARSIEAAVVKEADASRAAVVSAAASAWAEARPGVLTSIDQELARAESAYDACVHPEVNVRTGVAEPVDEVRAARLLAKVKALHVLRLDQNKNYDQKVADSKEAAQRRKDLVSAAGMSMLLYRPMKRLQGITPQDLKTLELRYGPFLRVLCVDDLCSGRLMAPLIQGERAVLGRALQPPNILVPSKFVRDYHVGVSCDLETASLEVAVLRERSRAFLNAVPLVHPEDDEPNASAEGEGEGEPSKKLVGSVRIRHGDCLALMEGAATMFEVVHNHELVNSIRAGEVTLESLDDGHVPSLVWDWNIEMHRTAARQAIEDHMDELREDAKAVPDAAKSLITLLGGKLENDYTPPPGLEDEVALLMNLVAECNMMAAYMDRDYLFEVQVKAFSVYGLEHPHQGVGGGHGLEAQNHHRQFHHKKDHHGGKEDPCAWVFVDSVSDLVPDALWPAAKFAARVSLLREAFEAWLDCGEDNDQYIRLFPPDLDPFYDPPKQKLLGVAYCYLASLNYLIPITEAPQVVSFKGEVVGEVEVEVHPVLDTELMAVAAQQQVFHTEELTLKNYIGELLHLRFRIRQAYGLPRKLATNCFVTFPFFLEGQPLRTGTCGAKSTAPKWDQSITVEQIVTDDFINYILNEALEIEVWGAPDNHLSGEDTKGSSPPLCGDKFEFASVAGARRGLLVADEGESASSLLLDDDDDVLHRSQEEDADALKERVAQLQASLDEAKREAKLHSDLALSLLKGFDEAAAAALGKGDAAARVPTVLRLSHDRLAKLEKQQQQQQQEQRFTKRPSELESPEKRGSMSGPGASNEPFAGGDEKSSAACALS